MNSAEDEAGPLGGLAGAGNGVTSISRGCNARTMRAPGRLAVASGCLIVLCGGCGDDEGGGPSKADGPVEMCAPAGDACDDDDECCSGGCTLGCRGHATGPCETHGECGTPQGPTACIDGECQRGCRPNGAGCVLASECCEGSCLEGTCAPFACRGADQDCNEGGFTCCAGTRCTQVSESFTDGRACRTGCAQGGTCSADSDCCNQFGCERMANGESQCQRVCLDAGAACEVGSLPCCAPYACSGGRCVHASIPHGACNADSGCPDGYGCIDNLCQCLPRTTKCDRDAMCCAGLICADGACRDPEPGERCRFADDCSSCVDGTCG